MDTGAIKQIMALTVDTEGFPPRALLVRGTAAVDIVEGIPPEYLEASHKVVHPISGTSSRRGSASSTSPWPASS